MDCLQEWDTQEWRQPPTIEEHLKALNTLLDVITQLSLEPIDPPQEDNPPTKEDL